MSYKPCMARSSTALLTGYHRTLRTTPCKLGCPPFTSGSVAHTGPACFGLTSNYSVLTLDSFLIRQRRGQALPSRLSTLLTHERKTWRTVSRTEELHVPCVARRAVRIRVLIAINIQQRFFNVAIDSMFMATRPFQCRSRG
jgi:hypothetical protein